MSRGDEPGYAGRGDHDVGLAHVGGEVLGAGVAQGHGGVLAAAGEQQAERPADGDAATDHDHLGARDLHAVTAEQLDDAARRAGQRTGLAEHEPAQVDRVQAVGVLVRVASATAARLVEPRHGSCTMKPVHAGSAFSSSTTASTSSCVAVAGRSRRMRGDADLGAVPVLAADVPVQPGSSPTRTVPSPGTMPRSFSAATRAASSALMVLRVAVPSRIWAVMWFCSCSSVAAGPVTGVSTTSASRPRLRRVSRSTRALHAPRWRVGASGRSVGCW